MGCNILTVFQVLQSPHLVIVANAGRLPPTIVTTGVTLVELEAIVWVPAHVQDGYAKWALS